MPKTKTAKEPRWAAGGEYSAIPSGLPGRAGCVASAKDAEAACEKTLAGRENQARIHAAAIGRAKKQAGGGK